MTPTEAAFRTFRDSGEPGALAKVFDDVAPELLMVAVYLAPKGVDAEDLLQNTFVAAIESAPSFDPSQRLMPWLIGILVNQSRRERRDQNRRVEPHRVAKQPEVDPAAAAEAQEFAAAIAAAMRSLPQPYREVVTLSFVHGLTPKAIAQALSRPAGTVKAQLHRGREILRRALPAGFAAAALGWLTPGRSLAAVRESVLRHAGQTEPVVVQPRRMRQLTVVATSCIGLALVAWWVLDASHAPALPDGEAAEVEQRADTDSPSSAEATALNSSRTEVFAPQPQVPTGPATVRVLVRWHEGTPAPGVMVSLLSPRRTNAWLHQRWVRTDDAGYATALDWFPGPLIVHGDRGGEARDDVAPGGAHDLDLTLPRGVDVTGTLVDEAGSPLAEATITISRRAVYDDHIAVATSDARGRFTVRDVEPGRCISAIAAGHEPAGMAQVDGQPGDLRDLSIRVAGLAGTVAGTVTTPDGDPIAHAKVMIGNRLTTMQSIGVPPIQLVTNAAGSFAADSSPLNPDPHANLWVRAPGFAPWAGRVPIDADRIRVELEPGAAVAGHLTGGDGQPVAGARIELRDEQHHRSDIALHPPEWGRLVAWSDADGAFHIGGAASLRHHGSVVDGNANRATTTLQLDAGSTTVWNPVLQPPLRITGIVRDDLGTPLAGWQVTPRAPDIFNQLGTVETDAHGRFVIDGCEACPYALRCHQPDTPWPGVMFEQLGVRVEDAPLSVVVPRSVMATCSLHGTIDDPMKADHELRIGVIGARLQRWLAAVDPTTGGFDIGPVPPGEHVLYIYRGDRMVAFRGPMMLGAGESIDLGRIAVLPDGTLRARIVDAAGRPLQGVRARVSQPDGRGEVLLSQPDGLLRTKVPPGRYYVDVQDQVAAGGWAAVDVVSDARSDVVFTLRSGQPHRFVVTHPADGKPLLMSMSWRDGSGRLLSRDHLVTRRNDGSDIELVRHLLPGTYHLELRSHAGLVARAVVTAPAPSGAAPTLLELTPPDENSPIPTTDTRTSTSERR